MFCDFTAGLFAGFVSVFIGHPLDTIKTQQQLRSLCVREATKRIYLLRGWKGYYRGLTAPLVASGGLNALFFGAYRDISDYLINRKISSPQDLIAAAQNYERGHYKEFFIAGTLAGSFTTLLSTPMELVKTKLQSQMKRTTFKGPIDCVRTITKEVGIRGLYRGFVPLMYRDGPGGGAYIVAYEGSKELMRKFFGQTSNIMESIVGGGLAGTSNWYVFHNVPKLGLDRLLILPFDTIKTRMQADDHNKPHYSSMLHTAKEIFRTDGIVGLYRGFWSVSIRAFPVNATIFVVYEYTQDKLCRRNYW